MREIFGLPAHPLMVHAPIVLVPLLAVVAIALAIKPAWRARLATWFFGASLAVFVLLQVALMSGEEFDKGLAGQVNVDKHEELAETTRLIYILFVIAAAAMMVIDRRARRREEDRQLATINRGLAGAVAVLGILATVWIARTGHEGADLVWQTTVLVED